MHVDQGAVAWPGQIDLAPDAMYKEIKEKGVAVLAYSVSKKEETYGRAHGLVEDDTERFLD